MGKNWQVAHFGRFMVAGVVLAAGMGARAFGETNTQPAELDAAAIAALTAKTQAGDVKAMLSLADYYREAKKYDLAKSHEWLEKAAGAGDGDAAARMGDSLRVGELQVSGKPSLDLDPGVHYPAERYKPALDWYRKSADLGSARGLVSLGQCYERGEGVEANAAIAKRLYVSGIAEARKEAAAGGAEGMFVLGWAYRDGKGVGQNYQEAADWFKKASDAGDAEALYALGYRYFSGEGVEKDPDEALKLFKQAAARGVAPAMVTIGMMYVNGWGVNAYPRAAVYWYKQAADRGEPGGYNNLGYLYLYGFGVNKDVSKAVGLYEKAAQLGLVQAMGFLGWLYAEGTELPKDMDKARHWHEMAAAGGEKASIEWLAKNAEAQNRNQPAKDVKAQ